MFYLVLSMLKKNNLLGILKFAIPAALLLFFCFLFKDEIPFFGRFSGWMFASLILLFAIVFRFEIRRGVLRLASPFWSEHSPQTDKYTDEELQACVSELVKASISLAKAHTGALIVLAKNEGIENIAESGTRIDSVLSAPLLECLFNTGAPLHDGAVVINGTKIIAAGCFLPLSQSTDIPKELGTRHRAGIGISENSDVLTIICSEETGVISTSHQGVFQRYYDAKMLTETLQQFYGLKAAAVKKRGRGTRQL